LFSIGILDISAVERQVGVLKKGISRDAYFARESELYLRAMLAPRRLFLMAGTSTSMVDAYDTNFTDVFAYMTMMTQQQQQPNAWDATNGGGGGSKPDNDNDEDNDEDDDNDGSGSRSTTLAWLLRKCTIEKVLDICHRLRVRMTKDWVARPVQPIPNNVDTIIITNEHDWSHHHHHRKAEEETMEMMLQVEPFCRIVDECNLQNFVAKECRPSTCPFRDHVRCRYLTYCLSLFFE